LTSKKPELEELVDVLRQQRDELRVQMHLAKAEARDEWEELEKRWEDLEDRMPELQKAATDAAGNIGASLELVADEIGNAYKRLRDALK
jgi:predicted nuclease with TOPRIM domain